MKFYPGISIVTRRNIFDVLRLNKINWNGQLSEIAFLSRLYNLTALPSDDGRFRTAEQDILQHRVNNYDWDDDWIYSDRRFKLHAGPDKILLDFLCAMVHPTARRVEEQNSFLVKLFNKHLSKEGYEVYEDGEFSGHPVFAHRELSVNNNHIVEALDTAAFINHLVGVKENIEVAPEPSVGASKDSLETVGMKTISAPGETIAPKQVFIVHGHDEDTKIEVSDFIKKLKLEPVILHEQASRGMNIFEKLEEYTDVGFAVVLYTPCDKGGKYGSLNLLPRARQNVVFEHGYLMGKLGQERVTALVKGQDIERPNDISGKVYIPLDDEKTWQSELVKEMKAVGYLVSS